MSLARLGAGFSALSVDVFQASKAAERAAGAFAAASKVVPRLEESVGFNRVDTQAGRNLLAQFTRTDQSVGLNTVDRLLSDVYAVILSPVSGLKLPGYGPAQDLITLAPFLRSR